MDIMEAQPGDNVLTLLHSKLAVKLYEEDMEWSDTISALVML
jgi:hypothetical protein